MSKDTDDSADDLNSLMKMIGSTKKKEASLKEQNDTPVKPKAREPGPTDDAGDFSALMKKLGMPSRQKSSPGPETAQPPEPTPPPQAVPDEPGDEHVVSFDDLLEDESPAESLYEEPPGENAGLPDREAVSSLGKLRATMNAAQQADAASPHPAPHPAPAPSQPAPAARKRR